MAGLESSRGDRNPFTRESRLLKLFVCRVCGNVLYFENRSCTRCGHQLAFLPEEVVLSALEPQGQNFRAFAGSSGARALCANAGSEAATG